MLEKKLLSELSDCQKDVVLDCNNNLYVTACPGSGKTRTLTRKLAYMSNLYSSSLKKIVAITYTNRAANEIIDRLEKLEVNGEHVWVGTIHQFCLDFILKKASYCSPNISKGFKIIDEYVTSKYLKIIYEKFGLPFNMYELPNLRINTNGECLETDPQNRKIVEAYHELLNENNEIDFDLILTLSLKILQENTITTQIISNIFRSIFIDEYQDTNYFQYKILGEISLVNPTIKFMFVGDSNQAIFTSLGGLPMSKNDLEEIMGVSFVSKKLDGCYRSTQRIIDLYSQFQIESYPIQSLANYYNEDGIIEYDTNIALGDLSEKISSIIKENLATGTHENEICILAPTQFLLNPIAKDLKIKLPDVNFRSQDIYPIKPDDLNVFYKISFLVFTPPGQRVNLRKKIGQEIIQILEENFHVVFPSIFQSIDLIDILNSFKSDEDNGLVYLEKIISHLFFKLEITAEQFPDLFAQMDSFFDKTYDRVNNPRLKISTDINDFRNIYKEKSGISISTIHKVKGEEYEIVIAFGFLEDIVPHFKSNNPLTEAKKLLYVTISRAKKRIYIFSERGRQNNNYPPKEPTSVLKMAKF